MTVYIIGIIQERQSLIVSNYQKKGKQAFRRQRKARFRKTFPGLVASLGPTTRADFPKRMTLSLQSTSLHILQEPLVGVLELEVPKLCTRSGEESTHSV